MAQRTALRKPLARSRGSLATLDSYLVESQRPLVVLAFLVPFILVHEIGARLFHVEVGAAQLLKFLASHFGIYGRTVPAVLVIITLLFWHLIEQHRWRVPAGTLLKMACESVLFAIPIFAISWICQQYLPLATGLSGNGLMSLWSLSLGAGVYEELLFRLYICGALLLVCHHLFRAGATTSTVVAVVGSAVLFSLYHYMGAEQFTPFTFVFRTLAGIYFAGLFAARGFGITAGAHAFYDVIVVTLAHCV